MYQIICAFLLFVSKFVLPCFRLPSHLRSEHVPTPTVRSSCGCSANPHVHRDDLGNPDDAILQSLKREMSHAAPAPPPPPPPPPPQACSTFTSREKCDSYFNPTEPKCTWDANAHCISRVSKMFDVFESNTVASWGTLFTQREGGEREIYR